MSHAEDRSAPEGADCREHPDRRAHFTCPRCGHHVCFLCWQDVVDRCHACVARDPTAGIDPLPWEQRGRSAVARYVGTLASALRPRKTAPAFAYDDVAAAWRFALLSALPLAMLAGIIPHTRTLSFGDVFGVSLVGQPDGAALAVDVVRAIAVQVALTAIELVCLALPFTSLVKAYGPPGRARAALRVVLYRGWLIPAAWLIYHVGVWGLPLPPEALAPNAELPAGFFFFRLVRDLLPVLLLLSMVATARLACGLGPVISMVVVLVPALVFALGGPLATAGAIEYLLPPMETP